MIPASSRPHTRLAARHRTPRDPLHLQGEAVMSRIRICALGIVVGLAVRIAVRAAEPLPRLAAAETLYISGDLAGAEAAFQSLQPAKDDTTIRLRRASLRLLRNDRSGARATLA